MSKAMCMLPVVLLIGFAPLNTMAGSEDIGTLLDEPQSIVRLLARDALAIPSSSEKEVDQPASIPLEFFSVRHSKDLMLTLTAENFATTVLKKDSPVQHWIIKFCIDSWQCRKVSDVYKELSAMWQKSLNFSPAANLPVRFANTVRFAEVDCSTHRQLCIEQGIESLPSVVHFHRKDLGKGSSKISAVHTLSGDMQSLAEWLESKLKPKEAKSADSTSREAAVKLPAEEPPSTKPPNAWEQATAELAVMMQGFDDLLDKQEVPRHAAYTCLLAISLALAASLWRLGWWPESLPMAAPEPAPAVELRRDSAQSHAAMQQPVRQELRHMSRVDAPMASGSMEL